MRIFITGNAGAGKTTLSKKLSYELGIPVQSLDKYVWLSGWKRESLEKIKEKLSYEVLKDKWIIEGVSSYVMEHADVIIFLDVSICKAYWRVIKRTIKHIKKQRPEMPKDCPEFKIIKELFRIIWIFNFQVREKMLKKIQTYGITKKVFYYNKDPFSDKLVENLKNIKYSYE